MILPPPTGTLISFWTCFSCHHNVIKSPFLTTHWTCFCTFAHFLKTIKSSLPSLPSLCTPTIQPPPKCADIVKWPLCYLQEMPGSKYTSGLCNCCLEKSSKGHSNIWAGTFAIRAILVRPSVIFILVLLYYIFSQFHHLVMLVRAGELMIDIVEDIDLALIFSVQHFSESFLSLRDTEAV